jgi:hypothetical protein
LVVNVLLNDSRCTVLQFHEDGVDSA